MTKKKQNELTSLENQIIIIETYNKWYDSREKEYEMAHMPDSIELTDLEIQREDLLDLCEQDHIGSSVFSLVYLILMSLIYLIPPKDELTNYIFGAFWFSFTLLVFCFFSRPTKAKRPLITILFPILSSSFTFYIFIYTVALFAGGKELAFSFWPNEITKMDIYNVARWLFFVLAIVLAVILLVQSIIKVAKKNNLIDDSKEELKQIEKDIEALKKSMSKEREEYTKEIVKRKDEYFLNHKLILPKYSIEEIKEIIGILKRENIYSLDEALGIYKGQKNESQS